MLWTNKKNWEEDEEFERQSYQYLEEIALELIDQKDILARMQNQIYLLKNDIALRDADQVADSILLGASDLLFTKDASPNPWDDWNKIEKMSTREFKKLDSDGLEHHGVNREAHKT